MSGEGSVKAFGRAEKPRHAGIAQRLERQPSKLGVAGSNPVSRSISTLGRVWQAHVAQLAEHVLGKDGVTGSSPVMGSMNVWVLEG